MIVLYSFYRKVIIFTKTNWLTNEEGNFRGAESQVYGGQR